MPASGAGARFGAAPRGGTLHSVNPIRLLLFGRPISTDNSDHARLSKRVALPVFASDAISSSAYATQEILLVIGAAGLWSTSAGLYRTLPIWITAGIVGLLAVVAISYWQTIYAYPSGGGSYIVSKDNLGPLAGLVAGGALLVDYVLTVAVSIASGVQNLLDTPVMAGFAHRQVAVCLVFIGIICLANLRGLRESGTVFAPPTYLFITMVLVMTFLGFFGPALGWKLHPEAVTRSLPPGAFQPMGSLAGMALVGLVLKAFAGGCAAMTGTEAVSNGIPAFRAPESRNASRTLAAMAIILGVLFLCITGLAVRLGVVYGHAGHHYTSPAVIDQLAGAVFGRGSALYYLMQAATVGILVLAANTSFADFPRLAAILSRDRYLPRQLSNQGDKLVFSNGIVILAVFAALLVAVFHGSVDRLIPLYAVGVFTAFTMSQSGMVRHWMKERGARWRVKAAINGFGALCTGVVLLVIATEKFREGAWVVVILVLLIITVFRGINRHYEFMRSSLTIATGLPERRTVCNTVLLPVPSLHRGIFPALDYAFGLSPDCRAIHVEIDPGEVPRLMREWEANVGDEAPLVILQSPYRSFIGPFMAYVDEVIREREDHTVTVVLPELAPLRWWHSLLHNANGPLIRFYLSQRPGVVVVNVRYFLDDRIYPPSDPVGAAGHSAH
jgi:amino acid transporter